MTVPWMLVLVVASQQPVKVDSETISGLGARNIGSAAMSGRVAALAAVHEGSRLTVYVGAASGGVWKSVNGGTTYKPVFDKQPVQSIGAIAVDPKNPQVVWVGTGEAWTRNSVSIGDGVYKSSDGGDNWTNVGLKESERVAKILVDPTESNVVYVCVPGKLWSDSDVRGVYKTTDGGKSWTRVLKGANTSTGCSMLSLDPQNPKTIFAACGTSAARAGRSAPAATGPRRRAAAACSRARTAARHGPRSMIRAPRVCRRSRGDASPSASRRRSRTACTRSSGPPRRRPGCTARRTWDG